MTSETIALYRRLQKRLYDLEHKGEGAQWYRAGPETICTIPHWTRFKRLQGREVAHLGEWSVEIGPELAAKTFILYLNGNELRRGLTLEEARVLGLKALEIVTTI